jgi:hypothetical protein
MQSQLWDNTPRVLVFIVFLAFAAVSVEAQCKDWPADTSFPLDGGNTVSSTADVPFQGTYTVTRVVGTGAATEFTNDLLNDPDTYVQNGVVSRKAEFTFYGVGGIEGFPLNYKATIFMNGQLVREVTYSTGGVTSEPLPVCVEVDVKYIKFAHFSAGGQKVTGANTLSIVVAGSDGGDPHAAGSATVGNLTFQAMAPIVLVHGWNAGPWVWADSGGSEHLSGQSRQAG